MPYVKSGSAFLMPAGMDADLKQSDSTHYTLSFRHGGEVYTFQTTTNGAAAVLVTDADRNGNTITYAHSSQQTTSVTDTQGRVLSFGYDPITGYLAQIADPTGRTWSYGDDGSGRLHTYTDPNTNVTTYDYDGSGRLQKITSPGGDVTWIDTVAGSYGSVGFCHRPPLPHGGLRTFLIRRLFRLWRELCAYLHHRPGIRRLQCPSTLVLEYSLSPLKSSTTSTCLALNIPYNAPTLSPVQPSPRGEGAMLTTDLASYLGGTRGRRRGILRGFAVATALCFAVTSCAQREARPSAPTSGSATRLTNAYQRTLQAGTARVVLSIASSEEPLTARGVSDFRSHTGSSQVAQGTLRYAEIEVRGIKYDSVPSLLKSFFRDRQWVRTTPVNCIPGQSDPTPTSYYSTGGASLNAAMVLSTLSAIQLPALERGHEEIAGVSTAHFSVKVAAHEPSLPLIVRKALVQ